MHSSRDFFRVFSGIFFISFKKKIFKNSSGIFSRNIFCNLFRNSSSKSLSYSAVNFLKSFSGISSVVFSEIFKVCISLTKSGTFLRNENPKYSLEIHLKYFLRIFFNDFLNKSPVSYRNFKGIFKEGIYEGLKNMINKNNRKNK